MTKLEKTLVENEETLSPEVVEFPFDSPEERIETMLKCSVEEPAEQCKVLVFKNLKTQESFKIVSNKFLEKQN